MLSADEHAEILARVLLKKHDALISNKFRTLLPKTLFLLGDWADLFERDKHHTIASISIA